MDVRLADLIGPMLGADFLYAEGEVLDENSDRATAVVHRFWAHRHDWRVERTDGVVFIDGPEGSTTVVKGQVTERHSQRHSPGTHVPEKLLRPQFAPVWGRPGEDWRLTDHIQSLPDDGLVRVQLQGTGARYQEHGGIDVDPQTGRLHALETPGFTWRLLSLREVAEEVPTQLFTF